MSRGFLRFALAFASLSFALPAAAHISLERGGTHKSRYGDGDATIKTAPCGKPNGTKGTNVYTYQPGQTITVTFLEYVPHPGYFRFAFDNDGDNDFVTPKSIKPPPQSTRQCPIPGGIDQCGQSDFYNSPTVLPNMDNLDWHAAGDPVPWTYQVKLPDVECTNCTLQVIQVMEDNLFHGPYTPGPGVPGDRYVADVYYQCIDIVLKRGTGTGSGGAPGSGGAATGSGGTMTGMGGAMTGMGGAMTGMGGMPTNTGGVPVGTGGAVSPGAGGVTAAGGVAAGVGGTTAGTTGGAFGTGSVPVDPESDEEGGCAVSSAAPSSSSGWLAAASSLGLALLLRRARRAR